MLNSQNPKDKPAHKFKQYGGAEVSHDNHNIKTVLTRVGQQ